MAIITLENMKFRARHGVLETEKAFGNDFLVTLSVEFDTTKAAQTDALVDTLNYQEIYDLIKAEMAIPSELLEHLIQRISTKLMSAFPQIEKSVLKITKLNPPLGGAVDAVSIELTAER